MRARRIQGRTGDSVIKLRPLDPEQVSKVVRRLSGFGVDVGVEVDAIPGGFVCSGRLKCEADSNAIRQVLLGERPLRKLYTKEQLSEHGIDLSGEQQTKTRTALEFFFGELAAD